MLTRGCGAGYDRCIVPGMTGPDPDQPPSQDAALNPSVCQNLARNLRRLRKARGESQTRVGRATGLAQNLISELEAGKGNPKLHTLKLLAAYFGVTVADLIAPNETTP